MRVESFDLETSTPISAPVEWLTVAPFGQRLLRLSHTLSQALADRPVVIYRAGTDGLFRLLGTGPDRLPACSTEAENVERCPCPQHRHFALCVPIAAAGGDRGVLAIGRLRSKARLSGAQGYLATAYAEQIGALFDLERARSRVEHQIASPPLAERMRLFESIAVHARDSIVITEAEPIDLPGPRILYCNRAFTETTGYSFDDVVGKTPRILQGPHTDPAARAKLRDAFLHWQPIEIELVNYRKDGSAFWVELSIVPVANDDGYYTHWLSVQRDVTERKRAEELSTRVRLAEVRNELLTGEIAARKQVESELLYTAFHDSLTRLRNRAYFMDRLKALLEQSERPCAVLFLDLDRFKIVNDSLGHQAGDVLLKEVARRLRACARTQDTLARFGGDEFALLVEDAAELSVAVDLAERIAEAMRPPIRIGRQEVFASCSIGIVQSGSRNGHPEALMRDADIAMYVAKRSGLGDYAVFDEAMNAEAVAILTLQTDLQQALERGEFELAFQAIVDPQHCRIKGFEALVRWRHPRRGMLQPADFISVAEEMGIIRQIDRWVMREACARLAEWRARFPAADLSMSVNTSAGEFDDVNFVGELFATLAEFELPARSLELEITESIFLHPDPRITEVIAEIRQAGVRIGLDDFGTGYSSLSYLNRYLTDTIKIDKSFTMSLCTDDRTLAIVLLIIQLAKTLHVDVVAEGVETEEQAELLASMSCSHAQGYYFARPMTADDVTAALDRSLYVRASEVECG